MKEKVNVTGVPETMVQTPCMQEQKKQKNKMQRSKMRLQ